VKSTDVTAAVDALMIWRIRTTEETSAAVLAALANLRGTWIELDGYRYRWTDTPSVGVWMEKVS
jgi:hypothetical protein